MGTDTSRASLRDSVRSNFAPNPRRLLVDVLMGRMIIDLSTVPACLAPGFAFSRPPPIALNILLNPLACGVALHLCSQGLFLSGRLPEVPSRPRRIDSALKAERHQLGALLKGLPTLIGLMTPDEPSRFDNRRFRTGCGDPGDRLYYDVAHGRATPHEFCPTACDPSIA